MHHTNPSYIISFLAGVAGAALLLLIAVRNPSLFAPANGLNSTATTTSAADTPATPRLFAPVVAPPPSSEQIVIDVVKKANPAVVSIVISADVPVVERYFERSPFGNDPFFEQFFGGNAPFFQIPQYRENGTQKKEIGGGSGFLISKDGYIVTNRHVVDQKNAEYTVFTNDGVKRAATVVARDPLTDLAVLKIEGTYPYLSFGDSDKIQVGQTAIAIGNALAEFRNTVSVGVISGLARTITAGDNRGRSEQLENVIQTDAAINPGNSGGPLLNSKGEVVGVNVAVAQGSQNIGFAIPANNVKNVVASVQKTGKIVRPYLGVRYVPITPELKEKNKLRYDYGALVARGEARDELAVVPGSPADKAGIVENDMIIAVDGVHLKESKSLASLIQNRKVGDTVRLTVVSKGQEKVVTITLEAIPE